MATVAWLALRIAAFTHGTWASRIHLAALVARSKPSQNNATGGPSLQMAASLPLGGTPVSISPSDGLATRASVVDVREIKVQSAESRIQNQQGTSQAVQQSHMAEGSNHDALVQKSSSWQMEELKTHRLDRKLEGLKSLWRAVYGGVNHHARWRSIGLVLLVVVFFLICCACCTPCLQKKPKKKKQKKNQDVFLNSNEDSGQEAMLMTYGRGSSAWNQSPKIATKIGTWISKKTLPRMARK